MPGALGSGFRPSGLTQESLNNMITGAGALYFDLNYSDVVPTTTKEGFAQMLRVARAEGKALGATDGGCTVNIVASFRQITVDDLRAPIAASTVLDGWETASISATAKEATLKKITQVMPTAKQDPTTGAVKFGSTLTRAHFEKEVTLVVPTIGGNLIVYRGFGAINTSGYTVTTQSNNEATYPVEFAFHFPDLAAIEEDVAPIWLYEFDENGMVMVDDSGENGAEELAAALAAAAATEVARATALEEPAAPRATPGQKKGGPKPEGQSNEEGEA